MIQNKNSKGPIIYGDKEEIIIGSIILFIVIIGGILFSICYG